MVPASARVAVETAVAAAAAAPRTARLENVIPANIAYLGATQGYDAGRFSFNMPKGRCATCEGEGLVSVELLFMPSVYAPCPTCHGARYNDDTLKVTYGGKNIAEVLGMTVQEAREFFVNEPSVLRSLQLLQDIGLGYLRLGQPATSTSS
jgi:excinuclease ABC subunit A